MYSSQQEIRTNHQMLAREKILCSQSEKNLSNHPVEILSQQLLTTQSDDRLERETRVTVFFYPRNLYFSYIKYS